MSEASQSNVNSGSVTATTSTPTIFEQASRLKLRFSTTKGSLTIEDLWDLPLQSAKSVSLDSIAQDLYRTLKETVVSSFVDRSHAAAQSEASAQTQLKFDLVLHIINVRVAENEAQAASRAKSARRQELLTILEEKNNEALRQMTPDQLKAMIDAL